LAIIIQIQYFDLHLRLKIFGPSLHTCEYRLRVCRDH